MKRGILTNLMVLFLVITGCLYAYDYTPVMFLRVNGHDHYIPDHFSKTIIDLYKSERSDLEEEANSDDDIKGCELNPMVHRIIFTEGASDLEFKLAVGIYSNSAKYKWLVWIPFTFDLVASFDAHLEITDNISIVVDDADVTAVNLELNTRYSIFNYLVNTIASLISDIFGSSPSFGMVLDSYIGKSNKIFDPITDLEDFGGQMVPGADPEEENTKLIQSVPFDVSLEFNELAFHNFYGIGLAIIIDFLHGLYDGNGNFVKQFTGTNPSIPDACQLQYVGFSPQYWGVQGAFDWWDPGISEIDRGKAVMDIIHDLEMHHCRVEAKWNEIVPEIDWIDPDNVEPITGPMVQNYLDNIQNNQAFVDLDEIIEYSIIKGITPYIAIGQGIRDRMPEYNGERICPGTPRGANSSEYEGVDNSVYLYWLELYTRALVRHFKSQVAVYQIEGELNGARQAEVFDYNRMGSSWSDESFQTQVISTLHNAVKAEAPGEESRLMHCFHIFNMAQRIVDWHDYVDIIGVNFYANETLAEPVLGFMVGECVWAVQRIISYLDINKDIWVSETAYPSYFENEPEYTLDNQKQYIDEALNSAALYGAKAFDWLRITDESDGGKIYDFAGLVNSDNYKESYYTYDLTENALTNGKEVIFANKYNGETLDGSLSIVGAINSIPSGRSVNLSENGEYISKTNNEILMKPDYSDFVKHLKWNTQEDEYKLSHDLNIQVHTVEDVAIFDDQVALYFAEGTASEPYNVKDIKICDPWYVDAEGHQDGNFLIIRETTDMLEYPVFKNQNVNNDPELPIYSVRAPTAVATQSDIKVFTGWEAWQDGSEISDISSNSQKIWIVSPNSRETKIVVKDENIELRPRYETVVNTISDYTLVIPFDEMSTIPAGGEYEIADGFQIKVFGNFEIMGSPDNEIVFNYSSESNTRPLFYLEEGNMQYVRFNEFKTKPVIITDGKICLDHCIFNKCEETVWYGDPNSTVRNCIFYKSRNYSDYDNPDYFNCIFDDCYVDPDLLYNISYSLGHNVTGLYKWSLFYNISGDPCFINPESGNFHLQVNSPCIDSGDPDTQYNDPDGTRADMGAYYFPQTTFSGTIDSDTTWYGTITVTGDVTVASGAKLEIEPYTTVKFDDDTGIRVYGILQADGGDNDAITFTSSKATPAKGDWDYVRFENSSIDDSCYIKNSNIEYGSWGIYCYYAEPSIQNDTFSDCLRGIYLYHSSPANVETNYITGNSYGIYGNNSSPTVTDNYFLNNSSRGCYFYSNCAPIFFNNTFDSNYYGAYFSHSDPEFGPTEGSGKGRNIFVENACGIRTYYSDPFLGSSTGYNTRVGGYNEIYSNAYYNFYASYNSDVEAQWCWWGDSPPPGSKFYTGSGSSINYNNWLTSAPAGGGSSLAKTTTDLVQTTGNVNLTYLKAGFNPKKPNPNRLSDLWLWGHDLRINGKIDDAIEVYQKLVSKFSSDKLAGKALGKLYILYQKTGKEGFDVYLRRLLSNPNISKAIHPAIYRILMSCSIADHNIENAIKIGKKILEMYPDTEEEKMALFELVLISVNELENSEVSSKYLEMMKSKYPSDELTLMAREAMGEKINWALMKPQIDAEPVENVLPEKYALQNNYPNPFNPMTTIRYDLPQESRVTLVIYDIIGREVANLVNTSKPAGFHRVIWDAKDKRGNPVSSGVYIYRIQAVSSAEGETGRFAQSKKMVYIR